MTDKNLRGGEPWWEAPMKLTLEKERQSGGGCSEMAKSVKATVTKPDDLSLIPETHTVERKKPFSLFSENKFKGRTSLPRVHKPINSVVVVVLNF